MANWADISRNQKKHSDFAGRTQTEQGAYFAFFAGTERPLHKAIGLKLSRISDRLIQMRTSHSWRQALVGVDLRKATDNR